MAAATLITGKGKSGSWKIRGEQLGAAMGAEYQPNAEIADCLAAKVVVLVKRPTPQLVENISRSGRPWVWDIVDAWPQPCSWGRDEAIYWLQAELSRLKPFAVVFGTPQMQQDAEFEGPSIVLPHHSWQRYVDRDPVIRHQVRVVGYEGAEAYLGKWRRVLQTECDRRGWLLQINGDMTRADIGVALRDSGGYPAAAWKPGTKLSNLHALGIPALCSDEAGMRSVACGAEFWITRPSDIGEAFEQLADVDTRQAIGIAMRDAMLPVSNVARVFERWLTSIAR